MCSVGEAPGMSLGTQYTLYLLSCNADVVNIKNMRIKYNNKNL